MLTQAQKAAITRASASDFVGVELLTSPENWPRWSPSSPSRPAMTFNTPPRNLNRTRSSSIISNISINNAKRPHIAVLDSSFNPPTLAHLRLAASPFPPAQPNPNTQIASPRSPSALLRDAASYFASHGPIGRDQGGLSPISPTDEAEPDASPGPYTARLLLYSVRNVDKIPGVADASVEQRVEMMLAQAEAMPPNAGPTAVALVSAPTFVAKAKALVELLSPGRRHASEPSTPLRANGDVDDEEPAITFLVGTDTLLRIFDPRYYPVGKMDSALEELFNTAWIVCARRGSGDSADVTEVRSQEEALLARADVSRYVARGRIRLLRMSETVGDVSSTRVRSALRMGAGVGALRGLCCDEVAKYVLEQGLYRAQ